MKEKMKSRIKERNAIPTSNELNGEANRDFCSTEILVELHDQVRNNSISRLKKNEMSSLSKTELYRLEQFLTFSTRGALKIS